MSTVKTPATVSPWTEAKRAKAEAESKYMKIDKPGYLLLTGALKKWKESPNFIYLPHLRIAGESEVPSSNGVVSYPIFTYLTNNLKLTPEKAGEFIGNAYSVDSVVGDAKAPYDEDKLTGKLAPQFRAELEKQKLTKKTTTKKVNTITLADINNWGTEIKNAVKVPKKPATQKTSKTGGSHKVPLTKRLIKLAADKVLDVSGLGMNKPAKSISVPKSATTTKYGVNLQLYDEDSKQNVSRGVYSNNPESLKIALEQIYPGEASTINTYLTSWQTTKANATTVKPTVSGNVTIAPIPAPVVTTVGVTTIPAPVFGNGIASPAAQTMQAMFNI
jgi:hypothetical protein